MTTEIKPEAVSTRNEEILRWAVTAAMVIGGLGLLLAARAVGILTDDPYSKYSVTNLPQLQINPDAILSCPHSFVFITSSFPSSR